MTTGGMGPVLEQIRRLAGTPAGAELSDGQLLDQLIHGDREAAFGMLVRRHGPMVLGVCRRILHDAHIAEDAFQATFLVLFRKARALDRHGSVAAWLYTVAYHAALRARAAGARRQEQERQMRNMPRAESHPKEVWHDLQPVLDEELNRLPEKYRGPVLLCYLEEKTNEEAARLLGVPVGTIKSRLARARGLLRSRLAGRGVSLSSGLLAALLAEQATAAVPALLFESTIQLTNLPTATSAVVPAAELADGVLKAMFVSKLKILTVLLLGVACVGLGAGALSQSALGQRESQSSARAAFQGTSGPTNYAAAQAREFRPPEGKEAEIALTGRVVDAQGKPVAGADVAVLGLAQQTLRSPQQGPWAPRLLAQTKTAGQGRFDLRLPPFPKEGFWRIFILTGGTGHALGCQRLDAEARQAAVELRLPAEQVLRGRLVDLQGRAAAGVQVQVFRIHEQRSVANDLAYVSGALQHLPDGLVCWPRSATADAQGKFSLHGLARDWSVTIKTEHERFAPQQLDMNADGKDGDEVTKALAPARRIEGEVTYADTGKPVPNARVTVWTRPAENDLNPSYTAESRADIDGRFRVSLPLGHFITVVAYPSAGTPYLAIRKGLNWPKADIVKQEVHLALPRGILVRGIVREAPSGNPVAGAHVEFEPFQDMNPFYRDDVRVHNSFLRPPIYVSGPDGKFELVVLPGPGHLLINGPTLDYVHAEITTKKLNGSRFGPNRRNYPDALVTLNLKPQPGPHEATAILRRGVTIAGRVLRPDGKAVEKAVMLCRSYIPYGYNATYCKEVEDGQFELPGCDPEKTVEVFFVDPKNQLGARVELAAGEASRRPVTVRLQRCGSATARFVREDGKPIAKLWPVTMLVLTPGDPGDGEGGDPCADAAFLVNVDYEHHNDLKTDADGRATLLTLIPGAKHWLVGDDVRGNFQKEFTVKAGETIDLGEIKVRHKRGD